MLAYLSLEIFGDDTNAMSGLAGGRIHREPWVARLSGLDAEFGFAREFQDATKDYADANSKGSRGVRKVYWLPSGIYEIFERTSWSKSRRYFARSVNGALVEITRDQAVEFLTTGPRNAC